MSVLPSIQYFPSFNPSGAPSQDPSTSLVPSFVPSKSLAPSAELKLLLTPVIDDGSGYQTGSSADGVMFDIVAKNAIEIYSVTLGQMALYPMNIQVYTRLGSHYSVYDNVDQWDLIKTYTNFTYGKEYDDDPTRISFPPQFTGIGKTRAFYVAIVETFGLTQPMLSGVAISYDYLGVWAEDTNLAMMQGIKFFGISADRPFGNGTGTYDQENTVPTSGVYQHEGPGGKSYNLQGATIRYKYGE